MARRSVWLDPVEQAVLDQVRVRLISPEEQARWDDLITTRHYLKNATLLGEQLRHGAHDGPVIGLDGKTLKGSHSTHLVGALNLGSQRWLDLERVPDKTNEIPAAQTLIGRLQLDERIALLDALHTQTQNRAGHRPGTRRRLRAVSQRQPTRTPTPGPDAPRGVCSPLGTLRSKTTG